MHVFKYKGVSLSGRKLSGSIYALDEANAKELIPRMTEIVYLIDKGEEFHPPKMLRGKIKKKDLAEMMDEVSILLDTGYSIDRSFATIAKYGSDKVRRIAININDQIQDGMSISESFYNNRKEIGHDFSPQIKPAVESGTIKQVFEGLASQLRTEAELDGKIRSAMMQPLMMILLSIGMILFMFLYAIPMVIAMLKDVTKELPKLMVDVLSVAEWIKVNWLVSFSFIAAFACLVVLLIKGPLRYWWAVAKTRIPFIGKILVAKDIITFYRYVGYSLNANMTSNQSVRNCMDSVTNMAFKRELHIAYEELSVGSKTFSETLFDSKFITPIERQSISIGERSGKLSKQLVRMADIKEKKLKEDMQNLQEIMKPTMEIVFGSILGGIGIILYGITYGAIAII